MRMSPNWLAKHTSYHLNRCTALIRLRSDLSPTSYIASKHFLASQNPKSSCEHEVDSANRVGRRSVRFCSENGSQIFDRFTVAALHPNYCALKLSVSAYANGVTRPIWTALSLAQALSRFEKPQ